MGIFFYPEDGDRNFLQNVGKYLRGYKLHHIPEESHIHIQLYKNLKYKI
jgi:hypothetical protein